MAAYLIRCGQILFLLIAAITGTRAQHTSPKVFADRLLLGMHYGIDGDYVGRQDNLWTIEHYLGTRAGISLANRVYAGIQARLIRAGNSETPLDNYYMAGVWGRYYVVHPVLPDSPKRFGAFVETGFMTGNFAFTSRDMVQYYEAQPGQWFIPTILGVEYRVFRNLTVEGGLNLYYNGAGSWDAYGIAYPSLGINWHGW
ncbi:MAG: hypothetical protein SFV52_12760 [Saprospiraceae bacterium]|nr:hypothetical protein [Saprospiraceae bacterium]